MNFINCCRYVKLRQCIAKLEIMIVLKYTKTHENCPKGCKGVSYLNDDQEHKDCIVCGIKWNRLTNKVVKK